MIKPIQLLKESFMTYRLNLKNILNMTLPIVLLTIIAQYYSTQVNYMLNTKQYDMSFIIIAMIVYFLCTLAVGLFLAPALNRAVQKKEDGESFAVSNAYKFQKKNIWKFIMVNVWGFVYILKRLIPYIVISALLIATTFIFKNSQTLILIVTALAGLTMLAGVLLNINRFILYKTIFFSKDGISAKDTVKESMKLGTSNIKYIWKIIASMVVFAVVIEIVLRGLSYFIGGSFIGLVIGSVITIMFSMPYMLIIVAKGYVKVREI